MTHALGQEVHGRRPAFWVELTLVVLLVAVSAASIGAVFAPHPGAALIADPEWVKARLGDSSVLIVDARDLLSYRRSHIPGAVNVGDRDVHAFTGPAGRALKPPSELEAIFRQAGLSRGQTVVVYADARSRGMAERIFFILEYLGAADVKILAGGFERWEDDGGPVTREQPAVEPGDFAASPRAYMIAGPSRIESIIQNHDGHIVDVRPLAEYSGAEGSATRLGHIAGAAHLTFDRLFTGVATPKSAHQMRLALADVAVHSYHPIVVYGNSPVEAASLYFATRLLGGQTISIYEGSWPEWAADERLPVETPAASGGPVRGVSTTCW